MPALSMFFGIIVRMQSEKGGKHNTPHIHAIYGDSEMVVSLDGSILEGHFPNKQMKLLMAWMTIHEDELRANWELLHNGDGYFKIDPLRSGEEAFYAETNCGSCGSDMCIPNTCRI